MIRRSLASVAVMFLFTTLCFAANLDGRWEGKVSGPDGHEMALAFTFKVDGEKLTGTVESPMGGEQPITDGKVKGDELWFSVDTPGGAITHEGKLTGETLTMKAHGPWGDIAFDLKHPAAK